MNRFLKKNNLLLLIIGICFILFLPGFFTYFHQDDFIHLSVSKNINQVITAFNIFQKGEFPFYRPIPTQLYFFINKTIFGLNPLGYHVVNFFIFVLNILLVKRLVKLITSNEIISLLSSIFFAINSTHFAPLYSPAYIHELFYVLFGILTIDNFLRKKYFFSILFFVLALMSKETAIVLPGIIILIDLFLIPAGIPKQVRDDSKLSVQDDKIRWLPYFVFLGIYLYGHFFFYGIAKGPSYAFILGKQTINILVWYFLWALSTPNILIDFVGPGLKLSPVFLQVAQINGYIYLLFFPLLILIGAVLLIQLVKFDIRKYLFLGIGWFVVGTVPLIIFPLHKLATEQAFSLIGLSIAISTLLFTFYKTTKRYKMLPILFFIIYLIIAINSILLARKTHWIVRSAQQAENIIQYLKIHYPNLEDDNIIYFKNGEIKIAAYGSSRQLYQATGNGEGIKLVLGKPNLRLYFEDVNPLPEDLQNDKRLIEIDSSKFLGY